MTNVSSGSTRELLNNVTFLGRCYDILTLDPLSTGTTAKAFSAFEFPISSTEPIPGELAKTKPKGTHFIPSGGGSLNIQTQMLHTVRDVQTLFSSTLNLGILSLVRGLLPFSGSGSYQNFKKTLNEEKKLLALTQAKLVDYALELDLSPEQLNLGNSFQKAITALPTEPQADAYREFIDKFGTHFSKKVVFGGLAHQRLSLEASTYSELMQEGANLEAQAQALFELQLSNQTTSDLKREIRENAEEIHFNGGTPSKNLDLWLKSVREDPAPVEMELIPLSVLFVSAFFLEDEAIDQKRALMEQAVDTYLEQEAEQVEWELWKSPTFGGDGGERFSDLEEDLSFAELKQKYESVAVSEVKLWAGNWVDKLQMIWETEPLPERGGSGGNSSSLKIEAGDYLKAIEVTLTKPKRLGPISLATSYLSSIRLRTNKGKTMSGGTTGDLGTFKLEAPENFQIVGFHGRSGKYIDRLGIFASRLPEA